MQPTDRQQAILDHLRQHLASEGRPPTLGELATHFAIGANAARKHLQALAAKGLIERDPGKARGIRLRERAAAPARTRPRPALRQRVLPASLSLPLVGRVAAGTPIVSEGNIEAHYQFDPGLFRPSPDYLLRVEGESMRDIGIHDGDLIAVHGTPEAAIGQVVVARLEGELTVKRLGRDADGLVLLSANPDYPPIRVPHDAIDFAIEGLYVGLLRTA